MSDYVLSWVVFSMTSLIHMIIVYVYFAAIFKMRYSKMVTKSVLVITVVMGIATGLFDSAVINVAINVLILALAVCLFYGRLRNRIIFAVFFLFAVIMSEFIVAYVALLSGVPDEYMQFGTPGFVFGLLLSRMQLVIFARIISGIAKNRRLPKLRFIHWVALIVPPIGSVLVLYNFLFSRALSTADMFSAMMVMIICCIVVVVYGKILSDFEAEQKSKRLQEQLRYYDYQYFLAEKSEKLARKAKHDFKNLLIGIQADIQMQNIENAQSRINDLLGDIDASDGPAGSGNLVMDSVINYKASIASEHQIEFIVELKIPEKLSVDGSAICQILGNALDNAIEATEKIEDASSRWVEINISYKHEVLHFEIVNPFEGKIISAEDGKILSSKRGFGVEGIGLESIRNAVNENQGYFEVNHEGNRFCLKVSLYSISEAEELGEALILT